MAPVTSSLVPLLPDVHLCSCVGARASAGAGTARAVWLDFPLPRPSPFFECTWLVPSPMSQDRGADIVGCNVGLLSQSLAKEKREP